MKHSLTYYLTILVIKLKGIKKNFSKDPIDYKKVRKEDIHHPKGKFFKRKASNFKIANTLVTEIGQDQASSKLLIFVHGGAFISGPAAHHWNSIKAISKKTDYTIWMVDYPKAPENKISTISDNLDQVYKSALERYDASQISMIGDSVGGTLIVALTQRLIRHKINLPKKIILLSPVMDASMSNPQIYHIEAKDPMLSKIGVLSAKQMCAENNDLEDSMISPLNGVFDNFPTTVLFLGDHDITYPDQLLTIQKLSEANVDLHVIEGKGMPHIWPFLPVMKEAQSALKVIIDILND